MTKTATPSKAVSPVQGRSDLTSGGFSYPAKLIEAGQEQHEGSGDWRLRMVFERLNRVWDDGNPVKAFLSAFTTYKGEPTWEGSDASIVADSFATATGGELDILSDDSLAGFIGHSFTLIDEEQVGKDGKPRTYIDNKGRERKAYLTTCAEYLGDESFVFEGRVTTVESQQGGASAEPEGMTDAEAATYLVSLFNDIEIADLRSGLALDIVKGDEALSADNAPKIVLGKPLRGGLVKPKAVLIDRLIEEGFATDEGGIFTASEIE